MTEDSGDVVTRTIELWRHTEVLLFRASAHQVNLRLSCQRTKQPATTSQWEQGCHYLALFDTRRVWWPQNEGVRPCCDCWWPCCRSWRSSWGRPSLLPSSRPRPRPRPPSPPPPQSPHSPPFTGGLALTPHPLEGRTTTLIRQVLSITRAQCNVVVETFWRMRQIPTKIDRSKFIFREKCINR